MTAYIINALINKGIPAKVARQIVLEKVLGRHIPEEGVNDLIESLTKELNKNMKKKTAFRRPIS